MWWVPWKESCFLTGVSLAVVVGFLRLRCQAITGFIVQECIRDQGHRQPGNLVALPARKPVGSGNISEPSDLAY